MHFQHSVAKIKLFEQNTDVIKFWLFLCCWTIHISMTRTFQCEYCQCFTFKRCDKFKLKCTSHGGMCSAHYFGKISIKHQNSECCNVDF